MEMNQLDEITTADAKLFEDFRKKNCVYKTGVYAFTFEHAYLVYYYKRAAGKDNYQYDYIAADTQTGLTSQICSRSRILEENHFRSLIPFIVNSIKYTGNKRNIK